MSSKKATNRGLVLVLLLVVLPALSVGTHAGERELPDEKDHKGHSTVASGKGGTASGDMVKTNDYGRYDPTPAFSKPRSKLIPN
uniref:Uncharacterized protein n=2 Tax=Zea mays TaxID=4577 RepID=B6SXE6_MAIZE|nr:hypothetical protein [Zea mays]